MTAIVLWTGILHGIMRIGQVFHLGGLHKRRPCFLVGLWGKGLVRIMGIKVHRVNERHGPPGDLVVANHLGFLDIPVLLSIYPAVFMIKAEMSRMRFAGRALRHERHIFVERDSEASRNAARIELSHALENGDRVIIFPEGRGSPGAERLPFKPYSFVAAKRLNKTVEVVALDYLPDRREMAWDIRKPMFPQFVSLLGRPKTHVSVTFLSVKVPDDPVREAVYFKELIEAWMVANDEKREVETRRVSREAVS